MDTWNNNPRVEKTKLNECDVVSFEDKFVGVVFFRPGNNRKWNEFGKINFTKEKNKKLGFGIGSARGKSNDGRRCGTFGVFGSFCN